MIGALIDGAIKRRKVVLAVTFLATFFGLVAYLTLRLGVDTLADAHADASRIEELIRRERPEIADVVVHTEPR